MYFSTLTISFWLLTGYVFSLCPIFAGPVIYRSLSNLHGHTHTMPYWFVCWRVLLLEGERAVLLKYVAKDKSHCSEEWTEYKILTKMTSYIMEHRRSELRNNAGLLSENIQNWILWPAKCFLWQLKMASGEFPLFRTTLYSWESGRRSFTIFCACHSPLSCLKGWMKQGGWRHEGV